MDYYHNTESGLNAIIRRDLSVFNLFSISVPGIENVFLRFLQAICCCAFAFSNIVRFIFYSRFSIYNSAALAILIQIMLGCKNALHSNIILSASQHYQIDILDYVWSFQLLWKHLCHLSPMCLDSSRFLGHILSGNSAALC